jgi:hypothetical protein
VTALAVLLLLLPAVGAGRASASARRVDPPYRVLPILFVPSDHDPPDRRTIDRATRVVEEAREWYLETLGTTFHVEPVRVVEGRRPAAGYRHPYDDILVELGRRGRIPPRTKLLVYMPPSIHQDVCCAVRFRIQDHRLRFVNDRSYQRGETSGGYVLQTEDFTDDSFDTRGSTHRNHAVGGGVVHELGHTFSLPHPATCQTPPATGRPPYCAQTPMWGWWNYPDGDPALRDSLPYGWLDTAADPQRRTLETSAYMWDTGCSDRDDDAPECAPDALAWTDADDSPSSSVVVDAGEAPQPVP